MALLDSWTSGDHTADGRTFPTYRKGNGPGVIVIHEVPGVTPKVIGFGEEVVAAGFTVVMPQLFGTPEKGLGPTSVTKAFSKICVSAEFSTLARRQTTPLAGWLRSLARDLHAECGGPGVGALGMCATGGFALAMMVDDAVAAPVLCQPSLPLPITPALSRDLGLSDADLDVVKRRVAGGCPVLGLEYPSDPLTGRRFDEMRKVLGDGFIAVELKGFGHSTVTEQRQQVAVDRVLDFFDERLR